MFIEKIHLRYEYRLYFIDSKDELISKIGDDDYDDYDDYRFGPRQTYLQPMNGRQKV